MVREEVRQALMLEVHRDIEDATSVALKCFGPAQQGTDVAYPPGENLTEAEREALRNLVLSSDAQSALGKILMDMASSPLFRLFCLMDGVSDPETGDFDLWLGVSLAERTLETDEGYRDMLHDEFFATYWDYKSSQVGMVRRHAR
jgi:hypothetical protein